MEKRRETSKANSNSALRIWLVAGASFVLLAAGVLGFFTRTVQADALLPRPAATVTPGVPVESETPALLATRIPVEETTGHKLKGIASWYGGVFNGRKTASGERFDMYAMTACHPTLPFGSLVKVVNLENGRSVVVRITDRGYLFNGRMLDLSYGAAEKLAMIKPGVAKVKMEVISLGKDSTQK
jgi:rare lipoprotein A